MNARTLVAALLMTPTLGAVEPWTPSQDSGGIDEGRLPVDPNAPLPEPLRELLGRVDPTRADWPSEEREREVNDALGELGAALHARLGAAADSRERREHGGDPPGDTDLPFVTAGARARAIAPAADGPWRAASPGFRVRRAGSARDPDAESVAFPKALGALAGRWRTLERRKFKVETVHTSEDGARLETQVLVHLVGELLGGGRSELSGRWLVTWSLVDGEGPRIERLEGRDMEELAMRGPGLVERTEHVTRSLVDFGDADGTPRPVDLGGDRPLPFGWGIGIGELRQRMDTRLGLPLLGAPAGIAVGDVNGDGWEDLYLCQPGGLPNRLLLHGPGHLLVDRSAESGTDWLDFSRGALLVDLDGDDDLDLAVTLGLELLLAENDGGGRFTTRAVLEAPQTTSLAAADFDLDGDLDLYACAYFSPYETRRGGTSLPTPYHDATNGEPNRLFENRGDWRFADVARERGMHEGRFSFAAAWEDYDDDGDPDLYVANDFGRNNLYRNDGGQFVDVAAAAGVEDMAAGMGVSWGDYDGDGRFDLCVSNMYSAAGRRVTTQSRFQPMADEGVLQGFRRHARGNSLFRNRGDGTFADESVAAGITVGRWAWGARFLDLNSDGRLDIVSPNGLLTGPRDDDL